MIVISFFFFPHFILPEIPIILMNSPLFSSTGTRKRASTGISDIEQEPKKKKEPLEDTNVEIQPKNETTIIPPFEYTSDSALRLPLPNVNPLNSNKTLTRSQLPLFHSIDDARSYAELQYLSASLGEISPRPDSKEIKEILPVIPDHELFDFSNEYTREILSSDSSRLMKRSENPSSSYKINDTQSLQRKADEIIGEINTNIKFEGLFIHLDDDTQTPKGLRENGTELLRAEINRRAMSKEDRR